MSYDDALEAPLQALGMVDAFDPERADFSKLTAREDAYISAVRMAGGPNAAAVLCQKCLGRAVRVREGLETDYYECQRCGHRFGIDWSEGEPAAPRWPPSAGALAEARRVQRLRRLVEPGGEPPGGDA